MQQCSQGLGQFERNSSWKDYHVLVSSRTTMSMDPEVLAEHTSTSLLLPLLLARALLLGAIGR